MTDLSADELAAIRENLSLEERAELDELLGDTVVPEPLLAFLPRVSPTLAAPLHLGRLTLSSGVILSPMEAVSDVGFRQLCHRRGAALARAPRPTVGRPSLRRHTRRASAPGRARRRGPR